MGRCNSNPRFSQLSLESENQLKKASNADLLSHFLIHCLRVSLSICSVLSIYTKASLAQQVTNNLSTGSIRSLTMNASSSFSVETSASSTPGVTAKATGNLIILPASSLNTSVTCATANCTAAFNGIGTSSSDLSAFGPSATQILNIDPRSEFNTFVDTSTATQGEAMNTGNASSGVKSSTSLSVTEQISEFTNTFQNTLQ
jgi:hypothetical protein